MMQAMYIERAASAAIGSAVSVMVSLSPDNRDISMEPLDATPDKADYVSRKLRPVGVVALKGLQPVFVPQEPLAAETVSVILKAFREYVCTLINGEPYYDWLTRQYISAPFNA